MRNLFVFLLVIFVPAIASAQNYTRYAGQTTDSLIRTTLNDHSGIAGMQEFNMPNASFIIYFQHEYKMKSPEYHAHGSTIFNILFTNDGVAYRKYTIDTIGRENGCWLAVQPDSLLFFNADDDPELEVCVVLRHTPICDAFIPYTTAIFFDNLETLPGTGTLRSFPNLTFRPEQPGFPSLEVLNKQITAYLKLVLQQASNRSHNAEGKIINSPSKYTGKLPGALTLSKEYVDIENYYRAYHFLPDSVCLVTDMVYVFVLQACNQCNIKSLQYKGRWTVSSDTVFVSIENPLLVTGVPEIESRLLMNEAGGLTGIKNPLIVFRKQP